MHAVCSLMGLYTAEGKRRFGLYEKPWQSIQSQYAEGTFHILRVDFSTALQNDSAVLQTKTLKLMSEIEIKSSAAGYDSQRRIAADRAVRNFATSESSIAGS